MKQRQEKLNDILDNMDDEELKEFTDSFFEQYVYSLEEQKKLEETYKDVYLNKYDVFQAIKKLAKKSAPMVSAQNYYGYIVSAGDVLDELEELEEYKGDKYDSKI